MKLTRSRPLAAGVNHRYAENYAGEANNYGLTSSAGARMIADDSGIHVDGMRSWRCRFFKGTGLACDESSSRRLEVGVEGAPQGADGSLPVNFQGRLFTMRPPALTDAPTFFQWRSDPYSLFLWSVFRRIPSYEEFEEEFANMLRNSTILIVQDRSSAQPIGFLQAYSMAPVDGYGHFMGFMIREFRDRGHGAEASLYFLDYLFTYYNLRKVYADVYEFNEASLRPLSNAGFVEEGRLGEHVYFNGRHWDLIKLALYREQWEEVKERFGRILYIEQELGEMLQQKDGHIAEDGEGSKEDGSDGRQSAGITQEGDV